MVFEAASISAVMDEVQEGHFARFHHTVQTRARVTGFSQGKIMSSMLHDIVKHLGTC